MGTFVEKYAPNISRGGIFIQSRAPQPVGTKLRFELLLQDNTRLLKGEGHVVWVKDYDVSQPSQAHGMGVRFTSLDNESQLMVERVLRFKEGSSQVRPLRHSETQEVRRLVTSAAPTDSEEPQQRPGTGVQLQVQPQVVEAPAPSYPDSGNGELLQWADEQLQQILQEVAVVDDAVDLSLARVLGEALDVSDIEELEDLLRDDATEVDEDPDSAREALRQMLGAGPVPAVRELTTEAPSVVVRADRPQTLPAIVAEPEPVDDSVDARFDDSIDSVDSVDAIDSIDSADVSLEDSADARFDDSVESIESMEDSAEARFDDSVEALEDSAEDSAEARFDASVEASLEDSVDARFDDSADVSIDDSAERDQDRFDSEEMPLSASAEQEYSEGFEAFTSPQEDPAESAERFEEELQQASAAIPDEQKLADLDLSAEDFEAQESLGDDVIFASRVPESPPEEEQEYGWRSAEPEEQADDSLNDEDEDWSHGRTGSDPDNPTLPAYDARVAVSAEEENINFATDEPASPETSTDVDPSWPEAFDDPDNTDTADVNMALRGDLVASLSPHPEEDEVFDALAGVRELRDRPPQQSGSSTAVPDTSSADPPSLEALAVRAKPATGDEEAVKETGSGSFDNIDVVVDDDDESVKPALRAPKSGLFRRLFGKD